MSVFILIPLLPLLAAVTIALCGRRLGEASHRVAIPGVVLSFGLSVAAFIEVLRNGPRTIPLYRLLESGSLVVDLSLFIDQLTVLLLLLVTGVSAVVHVYSSRYMIGDPRYSRFFAVIALFTFAMVTLVMSNNLLMTYMCWEVMGICSYLLISHWAERKAACRAATKAFLVNAVADVGLALGMYLTFFTFGTLDIQQILARAGEHQWPDCQSAELGRAGLAGSDQHADRSPLVYGRAGQVGPGSAARLAPFRHGGSDTGFGTDSCRDYGERRPVPARTVQPPAGTLTSGHDRHRRDRGNDRAVCGPGFTHPNRYQEASCLLDDQPNRFHDHDVRRGRVCGGRLPPAGTWVFERLLVPVDRQCSSVHQRSWKSRDRCGSWFATASKLVRNTRVTDFRVHPTVHSFRRSL